MRVIVFYSRLNLTPSLKSMNCWSLFIRSMRCHGIETNTKSDGWQTACCRQMNWDMCKTCLSLIGIDASSSSVGLILNLGQKLTVVASPSNIERQCIFAVSSNFLFWGFLFMYKHTCTLVSIMTFRMFICSEENYHMETAKQLFLPVCWGILLFCQTNYG